MLGAVVGDIVGTFYGIDESKSKDFQLVDSHCSLTDDSVMTFAVAEALLNGAKPDDFAEAIEKYKKLYRDEKGAAITDWGNGIATRVSPCAWFAGSLDEAEELAERSARSTHPHPDDIRGAKAISAAIYMARTGKSKAEIKDYIDGRYIYYLSRTVDDIRPDYPKKVSGRDPVVEALIVFLESKNFENAISKAISLGGRMDKVCVITGSLAEAFYRIPPHLTRPAYRFIDEDLKIIIWDWIDAGKPLGFDLNQSIYYKSALEKRLDSHIEIRFGYSDDGEMLAPDVIVTDSMSDIFWKRFRLIRRKGVYSHVRRRYR